MRHTSLLAVLGLFAASAARAADVVDLTALINERTVLVARIDVSKVNLPAAADWAVRTLSDAKVPAELAKSMTGPLTGGAMQMQQRVDAFAKAGVTQMAVVINLREEDIRNDPHTVIAIATADPDAVSAALKPLSRTPFQFTDLDGISVWAMSTTPNYVGGIVPAARPELIAAVADPAGAAVVAGGGLAETVRPEIASLARPGRDPFEMPAAISPVANLNSAALRIETGAQPNVVLTADTKSADALQKLVDSFAADPARAQLKSLPLKRAGNTISVDLRQPEIQLAAALATPALERARRQANRVKSMSNLRTLMQAIFVHVAQNKGALPTSLDVLGPSLGVANGMVAPALLTNPQRPELGAAGYHFVPAGESNIQQIRKSSERLSIYEAGEFGDGVNVGFWDGHVEFVANRARFDALLAAAKQAGAP